MGTLAWRRLSGSARRGLVAVVAAAAVLWPASPAVAVTYLPGLAIQAFAIWPPNYCGMEDGVWYADTYPTLGISSGTYSRTSSGGLCQYASPAGANVMAAYAKLEYSSGGSWVICDTAAHATNAAGASSVFSGGTVFACGHVAHRFRSEHRITYGGTPVYDTRYTSSYTP